MALNPFSGIISSELKNLHTNAISALLYDDACTQACKLSYGVTKHDPCVNCIYDGVGRKSSNRYLPGGPIPFPNGSICPMCNGAGLKAVETTENIKLMVIWDYKQFINLNTVNNPEGKIQTVGFAKDAPKIKRAKDIIVATDLAAVATHRFNRISEPQPCGFGTNSFIECLWERIS